jgi:hypothetical protein
MAQCFNKKPADWRVFYSPEKHLFANPPVGEKDCSPRASHKDFAAIKKTRLPAGFLIAACAALT